MYEAVIRIIKFEEVTTLLLYGLLFIFTVPT